MQRFTPSLLRGACMLRARAAGATVTRSVLATRLYSSATTASDPSNLDNVLVNPDNQLSPALYSLATRIGVGDLNPDVLLQAITHKSFTHGRVATNERLELLGAKAISLFVTEHLHLTYPVLPADVLKEAAVAYAGNEVLGDIARELGINRVMRWKSATEEPSIKGELTVASRALRGVVGAIYHEKGSLAARKFIREFILSRKVDVESLLVMEQPKRFLSALMKRKGMPAPVSRLVRETGRLSNSPVFIVRVYSDRKVLGEGFGSSLKMAEERAVKETLRKYYLSEAKNFAYPSDLEGMTEEDKITFLPQPLGDTQVIL